VHDALERLGKPFGMRKAAIDALTSESQTVLKKEWRRVKRGEPTYQWVKGIAITAVGVAVIALALLWLLPNSQGLQVNVSSKSAPVRSAA